MVTPSFERCGLYVRFLRDIHDVSEACGAPTFLWGGMAIDAHRGRFLREHRDIDGMTVGLWRHRDRLTGCYRELGYDVTTLDAFEMLRIDRDSLHAAFNPVTVSGDAAHWRHVGPLGTIRFPATWLASRPLALRDVPVRAVGVQMLYALKACPALLNPTWRLRDKDTIDLAEVVAMLRAEGWTREDALANVWTETPFWAERGFPAYADPLNGTTLLARTNPRTR